jgi:uncharacterized membrane protein
MTTSTLLPKSPKETPSQISGIRRRVLQRPGIGPLLLASTFFSCTLVVLRIIHSHSPLFVFMTWNLFLAYIPYALSNWLTARRKRRKHSTLAFRLTNGSVILAWLLFIPNTFYILTDLFHLVDSRHPRVPEWFDLVMIFSFAWNGLLLGILSVRQMEKLLPGRNVFRNGLFVTVIMGLSSLGVYTGRYLRYNSWDVISNPFQLTADMLNMIVHPLRNGQAWSMIACFTILLSFIYNMLKKISQALA